MDPVVEQPTATPGAPPPAAAPAAPAPAAAAPAVPAKEPTLQEHESANPQKTRHRARSQQAGPDDVPRIQNLTAKNRALQAELDALKVKAAPPATAAPEARTPAAAAAPAARSTSTDIAAPGAIPVLAADKDPEPNPADYVDDPSKNYVKDQARWEARQEIREANARAAAEHVERTTAAEKDRLTQSWARRETVAKSKYADFERVAYAPTRIPTGSMIDNYIIEAEAGLDVLYHLQKNPAELDAMLALKLFDPATGSYPQLEALTSLARRIAPGRSSDVDTGSSAAAPPTPRLPRPPNPVRTGPMSVATDEPPGDGASMAEHEAYWGNKKRR